MGNVHCDSFYLILSTFMNMPSGRHPQPYRSLTSHQVQNISLPKGFTGNPSGCSMGHHHHAPKSSHQCWRRAYQSTQTVQPQTVHIFMWTPAGTCMVLRTITNDFGCPPTHPVKVPPNPASLSHSELPPPCDRPPTLISYLTSPSEIFKTQFVHHQSGVT